MHGMHRMGLNEMAIGIDLPPDMLSIISHSISRDNLFEVATQCKMYTPKEASVSYTHLTLPTTPYV